MKAHPLANIFPLMEGEDFSGLVADIKANGQREPIVLFEDKILDGRNRFRACSRLRIKPVFKTYKGDDPLAFVVSLNLKRRHLNESQRAWIASNLVTFKRGGNFRPGKDANLQFISLADAALLLNVSQRSVNSASITREHGTEKLKRAVEQGFLPVSQGEQAAKLPNRDQDKIAAGAAAGEIRLVRTAIKAKTRNEKEKAFGKMQLAWPVKKYGVLLIDPPWPYDHPTFSSPDRATENHYPTMSLEEICALAVGKLAADDAVLFLWVTAPKLIESTEVIKAWGFEYKTSAVWIKNGMGMGYWFRCDHEMLLVCIKGTVPVPAFGPKPSSVIKAPRGRHSEKPEVVFEIIEQHFPTLPKIELFRRGRARKGWDAWGNEAQEAAE